MPKKLNANIVKMIEISNNFLYFKFKLQFKMIFKITETEFFNLNAFDLNKIEFIF